MDNITAFLLASLTHDMKSYLSVIDVIIKNFKSTNLTDEQISMLNLLNITKNSMCLMVNNASGLTRIENNNIKLNKTKFNIKETIDEIFLGVHAIRTVIYQ